MLVLGTLGLGAIAYFARDRFFGSTTTDTNTATTATTETITTKPNAPTKPERNFVKIMQQQVSKKIAFL